MPKFLANEAVERLDRFELIAELASGGMATVFLARLSGVAGFQRFVAIKRLHPHLANDRDFIQMFLDEARLAARLHHPHVVPIQEIGESESGYYLVMDYIEGDTLARLMARSAQSGNVLPARVAVRAALDTLAGLHAAHELVDDEGKPLEIVHRDVSPQNVLVGVDGTSRITDFGVARAASRLTTTKSGQLKGKLSYMAQEQAREKNIDRRSDIFAMGIVLWELLVRKRLFKGDGEAETLNKVMNEPIVMLREANPEVHPALEAVTMKALERDMDKRFPTAAAFADALEAAANESGTFGSHRDVATHLDSVIGTDISQQRDAVRAWLARSEPSKHGDPRLDGPSSVRKSGPRLPSEAASLTKIEGSGRNPKNVSEGKSNPDLEATVSQPHSVSSPLPVPNALGDVSSVSSAVLSVTSTPEPAPPTFKIPPQKSRAPLFAIIVVLLLFIAGGGIFAMKKIDAESAAAAKNQPISTPTQVAAIAQSAATSSPQAADKIDSGMQATVSTSASAAASAAATPGDHARHGGHGHGASQGSGASTSTGMPDDISHNPYR
ncbi:MAG: protein kinase domain-containing protein [Polyangiaceae bacterium]